MDDSNQCKNCDSLLEKIKELEIKINQLESKLSYYENPHSPPSKNSLEWRKQKTDVRKNRDSDSSKSKRGGISGHKGETQKFTSTSTTHHKSDTCPKCGSTDISQTKTHKRVMVEIPPPVPYDTTEHVLYQYNCKNCSDNFKTYGNLPPCRNFDASAIREVTSLFSKRMPYDTIRITLQERYGLEISCTNSTIHSSYWE